MAELGLRWSQSAGSGRLRPWVPLTPGVLPLPVEPLGMRFRGTVPTLKTKFADLSALGISGPVFSQDTSPFYDLYGKQAGNFIANAWDQ